MSSPSPTAAGLTTWFYVAACDSSFVPVAYRIGRRLLASGTTDAEVHIPAHWRDRNGGLTLIGIGLVLQMGRATYVDRCSISFHALPHMRRYDVVPETVVDFEGLATRLLTDADATVRSIRLLAAFLQASQQAILLEDLFQLMQANRSDLEPLWLEFIAQGRQSYSLFDLRSGKLHPPRTRLNLGDAAGWSKRRPHLRSPATG